MDAAVGGHPGRQAKLLFVLKKVAILIEHSTRHTHRFDSLIGYPPGIFSSDGH